MRKLFCSHAGTLDLTVGLSMIALLGYMLTLIGASKPVAIGVCMFPLVFIFCYDGPVLFSRINRQLVSIGDKIEMHAKSEKGSFKSVQGTVLDKGVMIVPSLYADEYVNADSARDFCVELETPEGPTTVPFRYLTRVL